MIFFIADANAIAIANTLKIATWNFDKDEYNFFFSGRGDSERTGFAVKKGIIVTQNPDFDALNVTRVLRHGKDFGNKVGLHGIKSDRPELFVNIIIECTDSY